MPNGTPNHRRPAKGPRARPGRSPGRAGSQTTRRGRAELARQLFERGRISGPRNPQRRSGMTHTYRFMEPVDVLFMRGNKLFGAPGSYGESLVPPWPSLAAGAIRSRMLVDEGIDLKRFAKGQIEHPQLGTPQKPGDFTVTAFQLARRHADGRVEILVQPPADLVVSADSGGKLALRRLRPGPRSEERRVGEVGRWRC